MKYKVGDRVRHFTGVHGMITKVFLDTSSYWFVYMKTGEDVLRIEINECEIDGYTEDNRFGFNNGKAQE